MKQLIVLVLVSLMLVACQDGGDGLQNATFDTSNLTIEEGSEAMDDFISYKTPSLEVALDAIPFEVTLPTELPFDAAGPFKVQHIWDWSRDGNGEQIEIEFWAISDTLEEVKNNTGEGKGLVINVRNFEINEHNPKKTEEVEIKDNVKGQYRDSILFFEVDSIYYYLHFPMGEIENPKNELINLAKQMF